MMQGKIKIVNGNVVREGDDIETGSTTNANNNNANNNNNNNFVNNLSNYHKGAIAFLICMALFGMRVAFPLLMMFVLYNVYLSSSSSSNGINVPSSFRSFFNSTSGNNNRRTTTTTSGRRNNNGRGGGGANIRTVSDLPKPPPSS